MITDEEIDAALEYLRLNGAKAAKAKADRIYMEEYRKTVKANVMQLHLDKPVTAQEREAYSSDEYHAHLEVMRNAIEADEKHRWGLIAAQAKIEAWRTQSSNRRTEGKI